MSTKLFRRDDEIFEGRDESVVREWRIKGRSLISQMPLLRDPT